MKIGKSPVVIVLTAEDLVAFIMNDIDVAKVIINDCVAAQQGNVDLFKPTEPQIINALTKMELALKTSNLDEYNKVRIIVGPIHQ